MSCCIMHLALVAQGFPEIAETPLAAPFETSPPKRVTPDDTAG